VDPEYPVGRELTVHPSVDGEVDQFSIVPALPAGLSLNPQTGTISGTPTAHADAASSYVVTAANDQGAATCPLTFACKVLPPERISYPSADSVYHTGEPVSLGPQVAGGVDKFSIEPALPEGMTFDEGTGLIAGAPSGIAAGRTYTITASNLGGQTSCQLEFRVDPAAPESLDYPTMSSYLMVETPVEADAEVHPPSTYKYTVEPPLPAGLTLDEDTGRISGMPEAPVEPTEYVVTATNVSGSVSMKLSLTVEDKPEEAMADAAFAEELEQCEDLEVLEQMAPNKDQRFGDWMIWMVHRAHLNDPTLEDFNFTHCKMPLPWQEYRVAPKLMKALETNTHIKKLSLAHSFMQKPQGHQMGEALKKNCTIEVLNLESNHLDSACLLSIAEGIGANPNTSLRELRVSHQQGMGRYYGRPVEVAFTETLRKNTSICKLGLYCDDANCRDVIDRSVLRNNDRARRNRKERSSSEIEQEIPMDDKTLHSFVLMKPPMCSVDELLGDGEGTSVFKVFIINSKKVPTPSQLQAAAKNAGTPMPYAKVKPTLDQCRQLLLNAALRTGVTITDSYGTELSGQLLRWECNKTGAWTMELLSADRERRYKCKSTKEPAIAVSDAWSEWLQGTYQGTGTIAEEEEDDTRDDESV
jgi:hypothetical protein